MKKLFFLGLLLLIQTEFVLSQTASEDGDILISSNVAKHAYILSLQDLSFGSLNVSGSNTASGTIVIRCNYKSWAFKVYAEKGALAEWEAESSSYIPGGDTIPYTFTFNSASAVPETRIMAQPVPTTSNEGLIATFSEKTKFGANGEPFLYSVEIIGLAGGSDWTAGNYHEVLYISVIVN
jgi:spore coat protein U-like protein